MSQAEDPERRRRARRRATAEQGPPAKARREPTATPPAATATPPARDKSAPKQRRDGKGRGRSAAPARGDRDLAGSGSSQLGPTGAMRARDVNRPTAEDLAEAEAELTIVRRNWNPADEPTHPHRRRS